MTQDDCLEINIKIPVSALCGRLKFTITPSRDEPDQAPEALPPTPAPPEGEEP